MPVIAAKVADLGRRFYPSETAFPLEFLARRLEAFAWDQRATSSSAGWVPLALRQAGVDWERIFDVFFATFDEKVRPACTQNPRAPLPFSANLTVLYTSRTSLGTQSRARGSSPTTSGSCSQSGGSPLEACGAVTNITRADTPFTS